MQVDNGYATELAEQLCAMRVKCDVTVSANCPEADQPRVLRSSLATISALSEPLEINLKGWSSTPAVVAELAHLPACCKKVFVGFKSCEPPAAGAAWPLAQAPSIIPRAYSTWSLDASCLHKDELASVLRAPHARTIQEPLHMVICCAGELRQWAKDHQAHMQQHHREYAHVEVTLSKPKLFLS